VAREARQETAPTGGAILGLPALVSAKPRKSSPARTVRVSCRKPSQNAPHPSPPSLNKGNKTYVSTDHRNRPRLRRHFVASIPKLRERPPLLRTNGATSSARTNFRGFTGSTEIIVCAELPPPGFGTKRPRRCSSSHPVGQGRTYRRSSSWQWRVDPATPVKSVATIKPPPLRTDFQAGGEFRIRPLPHGQRRIRQHQ